MHAGRKPSFSGSEISNPNSEPNLKTNSKVNRNTDGNPHPNSKPYPNPKCLFCGAEAEALESLSKKELLSMLKFGADRIFANAEGKPPSDAELDALIDRSAKVAATAGAHEVVTTLTYHLLGITVGVLINSRSKLAAIRVSMRLDRALQHTASSNLVVLPMGYFATARATKMALNRCALVAEEKGAGRCSRPTRWFHSRMLRCASSMHLCM